MGKERASIFAGDDEPDFDVSGFTPTAPRPAPKPRAVAAISDEAGFRSRERAPAKRASRTGRNVQFNLKASPETIDRFHEINKRQGWSLAITLERALAALECNLEDRR